ncbi:MAG: glycosyltransferase [Candidatus Saccharimonadales bacterium]
MMVEEIADHTEDLYTADYFEKASDTRSGYTNYLSSPAVNLLGKFGLCKQFIKNNGRHMDLGAADGSLMEIFAAAGYETVGLEISQDVVDIAKSKGLRSLQSNLHSFPEKIGKFDIITAFDLLEHADRPGLVLDNVVDHLNDDGFFVFSTLSVTQYTPDDYWFSHSLEHYIYYDTENLTNVLTDKFGKGNFAFTAIEVNGVSEFWGFAKKGIVRSEKKIITNLSKNIFDKQNQESGYYISLFYNQLSRFELSSKVIKNFETKWDQQTLLLARFYHFFYQGKYEKALQLTNVSERHIPSTNALYWQAMAFMQKEYAEIRIESMRAAYENQIDSQQNKIYAYQAIVRSLNTRLFKSGNSNIITATHSILRSGKKVAKKILKRNDHNPALHRNKKPHILITMPWMTFGGAETLVYNYCRELKKDCNISFITGLDSKNEWEYKFREITESIYHLTKIVDDPSQYIEFISGYIDIAQIDILHIVHNGFMFEMLPELKKRHPNLKIILTLFNDRVPAYMEGALKYRHYIDKYTTDNQTVSESIKSKTTQATVVEVISNGIDSDKEFNPVNFNREFIRDELGIADGDVAVFFVGRLSGEKNPDVFVSVAEKINELKLYPHVKFFIIGDGIMKQQIINQIKSIESSNITLLGYQSKVAHYLSAGDVFVLPSSIEGFPLSILEAMSMKLSVIASDVGAVSEVVVDGESGYIVKPGNVDEILDKLKIVITSPKLLQKQKRFARNRVEKNFSNKILKKNYLELYRGM